MRAKFFMLMLACLAMAGLMFLPVISCDEEDNDPPEQPTPNQCEDVTMPTGACTGTNADLTIAGTVWTAQIETEVEGSPVTADIEAYFCDEMTVTFDLGTVLPLLADILSFDNDTLTGIGTMVVEWESDCESAIATLATLGITIGGADTGFAKIYYADGPTYSGGTMPAGTFILIIATSEATEAAAEASSLGDAAAVGAAIQAYEAYNQGLGDKPDGVDLVLPVAPKM